MNDLNSVLMYFSFATRSPAKQAMACSPRECAVECHHREAQDTPARLRSGNKIFTIKIYTGTMSYYCLKDSTKVMTMPTEQTFRQHDAALQSEFELTLQ